MYLLIVVMALSSALLARQDGVMHTRTSDGPVVILKNGSRPTYLEFGRSGYPAKGSVGALGGFEMNVSANMDYADNVHRFYDPTQDAYWSAWGPLGYTLQYAPAGASADIWASAGVSAFHVDVNALTLAGSISLMRGQSVCYDGSREQPQDNGTMGTTCTNVDASGAVVSTSYKNAATYRTWIYNSISDTGGASAWQRSGVDVGYVGPARSLSSALNAGDFSIWAVNTLQVRGEQVNLDGQIRVNGADLEALLRQLSDRIDRLEAQAQARR